MLTIAGAGVTCLPLTVMSTRLLAGVEAEGVGFVTLDDGVANAAEVGEMERPADVGVDDAAPVWEQDASAIAAVRPNAGARRRRSRGNLVIGGSLGRFV